MKIITLTIILISSLALTACHQSGYYHQQHQYTQPQPNTVPYVSAHHANYKEYVTEPQKNSGQEYISAWLEAQMEEERNGISVNQQNSKPRSDLWGTPPGIVGAGVTLINKSMRESLNDALSTTPLNGQAKWKYGDRQFMFMPNSEVYQPYHSGGNCRDAIIIHFGNSSQERLRGLFCQQGRGSDWLLVK